jgi:nucleoside-diphosphate-sugar epimerase
MAKKIKKIMVTGSVGQIGSELTLALRERYGAENVVACGRKTAPSPRLKESGPFEWADVTEPGRMKEVIQKYGIDTIVNMAALLSAVGEKNPQLCWSVNVTGLINTLELARELELTQVLCPSSIAVFGAGCPRTNTPNDTVLKPTTMYGVTKVTGELLSDYYYKKFGVDARGLRYPGIISNVTLPGGGTTDYAVEIYYAAIKEKKFTCPLPAGTFLDMMYMPDALDAAIDLMEADPSKLIHRNAFNVSAMSFDPEIIYKEIKKHIPDFVMTYNVEPMKKAIADTWPNSMDDSAARAEWGWNPKWKLDNMTVDMLKVIGEKHKLGLI